MKIRALTFGIKLSFEDIDQECLGAIKKIDGIVELIKGLTSLLADENYVIQTVRIAFNRLEEWLHEPQDSDSETYTLHVVKMLSKYIECNLKIQFCSLGGCTSKGFISILPDILASSHILSCSVKFERRNDELYLAPPYEYCRLAAASSLKLFDICGDLGNFRYCASFNMTADKPTPFFPGASQGGSTDYSVAIGLESGDLLFLAFFGAKSCEQGSTNLSKILEQVLIPIQSIVVEYCKRLALRGVNLAYNGIDASINPGLSLQDSVGAGLENLLLPSHSFGDFGTLAAVSAITAAVKSVESKGVKLTGYSGLMLPIMEDVVLAERVTSGSISLRDILVFSSVCGVGLDTIPIPENVTVDELADVYYETGALAFRLNKPLSCRLLPMKNKVAGDTTDVDSPYLCNTTVFPITHK